MHQSLSNGALDVVNAEPHQFSGLRLARINAGSRLQRSAYVSRLSHYGSVVARALIAAIRSASLSAGKRLFTSYIARAISIADSASPCLARNVQYYIAIAVRLPHQHQRWALLMPTWGCIRDLGNIARRPCPPKKYAPRIFKTLQRAPLRTRSPANVNLLIMGNSEPAV
jgi:hypothetical protein